MRGPDKRERGAMKDVSSTSTPSTEAGSNCLTFHVANGAEHKVSDRRQYLQLRQEHHALLLVRVGAGDDGSQRRGGRVEGEVRQVGRAGFQGGRT